MEEETNNLPPITPAKDLPAVPSFLKSRKWMEADVSKDFLDFEEDYRPPRYTLERNGVPFANVGELHVISGKPGHGKTGLMSQLMAAVLCGEFGNTKARETKRKQIDPDNLDEYLKDDNGNVVEMAVNPQVLYIDTEQGKDDTIAIKNRVCTLAGIDYKKPSQSFYILRLRDTETAEERWKKVLKAVLVVKPTDIFLDGMLDIVKDYNDQVECQPIIRESMMLATHYDTSLWMVLHENPLVEKLVGTLGSIVQRKVAEIFTVQKIKQNDLKPNDRRPDLPEIYFRVKQVKARGRDVSDWLFEYVQNAGGWGMPMEIDENGRVGDPDAAKRAKEKKDIDEIFKQYPWTSLGASYTELEDFLRNKKHVSGHKVSKLFSDGQEYGIIYKTTTSKRPKYFYNGLYNEVPNDTPEDIPFEENETEEQAPF